MPPEISVECPPQGNKNQRDNGGGQENVADQNRKIKWPDPTMALKADIADIIVIYAVRDEECARDRDRT
jgi:hypothetical protein